MLGSWVGQKLVSDHLALELEETVSCSEEFWKPNSDALEEQQEL